eukprot:gb/GECG01003255.1/.p1 GENE.gb/GECG01003255.1/~~gb/GECG01003255.1/.p1  ORF type:complete len:432 (+),score=59.43 gb/GECG01003255.1/:1-1296(+)
MRAKTRGTVFSFWILLVALLQLRAAQPAYSTTPSHIRLQGRDPTIPCFSKLSFRYIKGKPTSYEEMLKGKLKDDENGLLSWFPIVLKDGSRNGLSGLEDKFVWFVHRNLNISQRHIEVIDTLTESPEGKQGFKFLIVVGNSNRLFVELPPPAAPGKENKQRRRDDNGESRQGDDSKRPSDKERQGRSDKNRIPHGNGGQHQDGDNGADKASGDCNSFDVGRGTRPSEFKKNARDVSNRNKLCRDLPNRPKAGVGDKSGYGYRGEWEQLQHVSRLDRDTFKNATEHLKKLLTQTSFRREVLESLSKFTEVSIDMNASLSHEVEFLFSGQPETSSSDTADNSLINGGAVIAGSVSVVILIVVVPLALHRRWKQHRQRQLQRTVPVPVPPWNNNVDSCFSLPTECSSNEDENEGENVIVVRSVRQEAPRVPFTL